MHCAGRAKPRRSFQAVDAQLPKATRWQPEVAPESRVALRSPPHSKSRLHLDDGSAVGPEGWIGGVADFQDDVDGFGLAHRRGNETGFEPALGAQGHFVWELPALSVAQ